jgi:hypothetical protein
MYQIALQAPIQTKVIPMNSEPGVLTHVELNYHEVQCIEIALIGLAEIIRNNTLPDDLTAFSLNHLAAQLNYLRCWLNKPTLKSQLRLDGLNCVLWPFTSSELVDWLIHLCQACISEDAILIIAADATSCEYAQFSEIYLEDRESYSLVDDMTYQNFSAFQHYYNGIVTDNQAKLVRKLVLIQEQGYPTFSKYSAIN